MSSFVFVTDLDNTLVGDDSALETLNRQLEDHRQTHQTKIVYATGRSLYLYEQLRQEKSLLTPDALITSVGTEIRFDPHQQQADAEWSDLLSQEWDRETIVSLASQFSQLQPQAAIEQNQFKVSYHLPPEVAPTIIEQLTAALEAAGLTPKLIYSGSYDLDIIPKHSDKGLAIDFLQQKWQVDPKQIVACGDSGNDIAMFQREQRGIIVGNAHLELRQWYHQNPSEDIYLAKANYAAGILEGLEYFQYL